MDQENQLTIPYNFTPREYQKNFYNSLANGFKRGVAVWHRRAGKDKVLINLMAKEMYRQVGTYFYFFPTYKQGKKILWNGIGKDGFRYMDHLPEQTRKRTDNTEMLIELYNGSIFQIIGTDNIDSIVGTNPIGCVFSEYALQNPKAWDFIRPILAENDGWALFNYTPRGQNHGFDLANVAKGDPKWFYELLTVEDTKREDGTPVVSQQAIEDERKAGMSDEMINQEFYCDFGAGVHGSYYTVQFKSADEEGRIREVKHNKGALVNTAWDLGVSDDTAIWFFQIIGKEIHVIDYYESHGEGLDHYLNILKEKAQEHEYRYGEHYGPHDLRQREFTSGKSRVETAAKAGLRFNIVNNALSVIDGIEAVRGWFHKLHFDKEKCFDGLRALRSYHKEFDENKQIYKSKPHHDWSSHAADAMRYLILGYREDHMDERETSGPVGRYSLEYLDKYINQ